jgi:hypothetical protein
VVRAPIFRMATGVGGPLSFPAVVVFALVTPIAALPFYPFQFCENDFLALFPPEWMFDSR